MSQTFYKWMIGICSFIAIVCLGYLLGLIRTTVGTPPYIFDIIITSILMLGGGIGYCYFRNKKNQQVVEEEENISS